MLRKTGRPITVGIIGGFGPEATAQFYLALVQAFRHKSHGQQPGALVLNVPVDPVLEHELLLRGKKLHAFLPLLTTAAARLERSGADMIVFPCNTLHVHADAIENAVQVPFVSIIQSSVQKLKQKHINRVGLLGTSVTLRQNLFQKIDPTLEFVVVPESIQKMIDRGIDLIVATQDNRLLKKSLKRAFDFLIHAGVRDVLLACTDFHGLCPTTTNIRTFDTVDILVEATVNML